MIKDAKFKFERNNIEKSSKDPKKLWEIINNKLGKTKKANKIIDYIYANRSKIVNKEDIANLMNTYFCEVGANLSPLLLYYMLMIYCWIYTEIQFSPIIFR